MRVLVTAGGTTEKIDEVRGISNFATGRLGCQIAENFLADGHDVVYFAGRTAKRPKPQEKLELVEITDTDSLMTKMKSYAPTVDVVVHSMAVSDYRPLYMTDLANLPANLLEFSPEQAGKISSEPEHQVILLEKTPKVLAQIKDWNPQVILFAFKLLVDVPESELLAAAAESIQKNRADFVLANDLRQINQQEHQAILVSSNHKQYLYTKKEIAQAILAAAKEKFNG